MVRSAIGGYAARLVVAIAAACLLAAFLALLREDGTFVEGLRASVWIVGCLLLLLAFAGSSPTMRAGTIDPWLASFYPKLSSRMREPYSGTRVSSGALFALTALTLFGIGVALN